MSSLQTSISTQGRRRVASCTNSHALDETGSSRSGAGVSSWITSLQLTNATWNACSVSIFATTTSTARISDWGRVRLIEDGRGSSASHPCQNDRLCLPMGAICASTSIDSDVGAAHANPVQLQYKQALDGISRHFAASPAVNRMLAEPRPSITSGFHPYIYMGTPSEATWLECGDSHSPRNN